MFQKHVKLQTYPKKCDMLSNEIAIVEANKNIFRNNM